MLLGGSVVATKVKGLCSPCECGVLPGVSVRFFLGAQFS